MSDFVKQNSCISNFDTSNSWVILSPIEQSIKSKIEKIGTPLKDWDINIYRGVLTGFNDAFIISGEKRDEILANCKNEIERKKTAELIRPILRGRDIKRYEYNFADLYLINTHNGVKDKNIPRIDIKDYPAIKNHLDEYWDKISTRADKVVGLAKKCKYLVCSKNFAYSLTEIDNYELMYEKLEHIFKNIVVVTLGKEGTLVRIDGEIIVVPSINVDAVDETGAGDAFHAGFVYGLLQNWDLLKIVEFSNKAGAYATTKMGTKNSLEEVFYGYK